MIETKDIKRPPAELVEAIRQMGAATASSTLFHMGIRNAHICGPTAWTKGKALAGPALTLQFMPKREDLYGEDEYAEPERQLHRHVLYHTQPGDIVVVDARGDMRSGIFGEMMLTYFKGKGGAGVVIDGCVRDYVHTQKSTSASGSGASRPTSTPRPISCRSPSTCRSPAAACW